MPPTTEESATFQTALELTLARTYLERRGWVVLTQTHPNGMVTLSATHAPLPALFDAGAPERAAR